MATVRILLGNVSNRWYFEDILQVWDYDVKDYTCGFLKWPSVDQFDAIIVKHNANTYYDLKAYRDAGVAVYEEFLSFDEFLDALNELRSHVLRPYVWSRFAPDGQKGLEVTSKGGLIGKRFSPFFMKHKSGKSLENYYQLDIKGYGKLGYTSWKQVKGEAPLNPDIDCYETFKTLYWEYFRNNPSVLYELAVLGIDHVFTDLHATSSNTQARAYSEILNQLFEFIK